MPRRTSPHLTPLQAKDGTESHFLIRDDRTLLQKFLFVQAGAFLTIRKINDDGSAGELIAYTIFDYEDEWVEGGLTCSQKARKSLKIASGGELVGIKAYQLRAADGTRLASWKRNDMTEVLKPVKPTGQYYYK